MKKRRDEKRWNKSKKCFRTLKPARWISPTCFEKKSLSDDLFLHFFCKSSESGRFWIIYMIRIRFFGPRELNQKGFSGAQYCFPKPIMMETGETTYEKVYVSPRHPPKISFKDNWTKELDSEVAGSSKDIQRIEPKPQHPIVKNGEARVWARVHKGNRERCLVWSRRHQTLNKNGETRGWTKIHPEFLCQCLLNS